MFVTVRPADPWSCTVRQVLLPSILGLAALLLLGLAGGGWHYSDMVLQADGDDAVRAVHRVTAVDPEAGEVSLQVSDDDDVLLARVGLVGEETALLATGPARRRGDVVIRTVELLDGEWPAVGTELTTDIDAFPGDPATTVGVPFDTVEVPAPLGMFPAWRTIPAHANTTGTWAVIVHGRDGTRSAGNRLLPTLKELGLPALSVSVRNDPGAPADHAGYRYLGTREWEELTAAVEHLRQVEGADEVVLIGLAEGAATVLAFLRHAPAASAVGGAVLVSPLVSLPDAVTHHLASQGVPASVAPTLASTALRIASWRSGVDLTELEYHHIAAPTDLPALIVHGDADQVIPHEPSLELAERWGAQLSVYPDTGHLREWNSDPERFDTELSAFLSGVVDDR